MQYKTKTLYKEILSQYPELKSEDYIEDYIKSVAEGIEQWSLNPKNLILRIPHFGTFHWRYTKLNNDRAKKKIYINDKFSKSEKHKEFLKTTDFVLELYKKFKEEKINIRKQRFGDKYLEKEDLKIYKEKRKKNNIHVDENGYKVLV